jgi:energy-coupling factor transporter ATP-binding protein EcfA2
LSDIIYDNFNAEVIKAIKKALQSSEVNPLYIYGPSGSGKSFLVQKMEKEYNGKSILIEAEEFDPSELNAYRNYDIFILEDIQLLPPKLPVPEESPIPEALFEITNYFIENEKQIVFTADCLPSSLNLSNRVISRIEAGVIVPIKEFDKTSKRKVIKILGKELSRKIIDQLTQKDIQTISQAIGAVKKAKLLGYVAEEAESIEKTKSMDSSKTKGEFDKFISEVKETFPERFTGSEEEEKLREEYSSKMYVWEMKGFNANRIKKVINGPIDKLTGEFVSFTMDIQRLIELQRFYGMLDIDRLLEKSILPKDETLEIEEALFNPDKVEWLTERINELKDEGDKLIRESELYRMKKEREETLKGTIPPVDIDKLLEELKIDLEYNGFRLIKEY